MQFYNTLTRSKEKFIPLTPGKVRMYVCGPTVYNYFHVGNARCFVVFDMLRRYLEYRGYEVTFVQNFTDIDDKVIRRAAEEGITFSELAQKYIDEYFVDAQGLGIRSATIHPKATENIDTIIEIIKLLIERGYAYPSNGDVYFRTVNYEEYGAPSHMPIEDLESGARIDISEQKENPLDFALWKAAKPGEPEWESPWGRGRPGWHIECSAMVRKYLGETIDIHCGGQDLAFPHHENEKAQSECATGKHFARYWLHNGFININNSKMSKSGSFFTVRDVAAKYGYAPIRHFLLSAHYRTPVNFSEEIIEQSAAAVERIYNCSESLDFYLKNAPKTPMTDSERDLITKLDGYHQRFVEVMDDDFNTGEGMAVIYEMIRELNSMINKGNPSAEAVLAAKAIYDPLIKLMGFEKPKEESSDLIAEIEAAIEARTAAKKNKNYAEADRIRAELAAKGVILEDTPQGTKYRIES